MSIIICHVGINVKNLESVPPFSFLLPLWQVPLVVFLQLQSLRWMALVVKQVSSLWLFHKNLLLCMKSRVPDKNLGWSWIFILEGLATILIGIACFWMVHDFPDSAQFLTVDERARVLRRLHADKQASAEKEKFSMKYAKAAYTDWKTYLYAIIYSGCDMPLYAFSLFLPTIIRELGFTSTRANLLSVPPYACAAVLTVAIGFLADGTRQRGLCNMGTSLIGITGFAMLIASHDPHVKYAGVFLGALGIYPCVPNTISWTSNNVEGVYKRGVTLGTVIGYGNLNGVISSNIYFASQGTQYPIGHGIIIGYLTVFLFGGSLLTRTMLQVENKKRLSGKRDHLTDRKTEDEIRMLGDKR